MAKKKRSDAELVRRVAGGFFWKAYLTEDADAMIKAWDLILLAKFQCDDD